jgi:hypothetical protein
MNVRILKKIGLEKYKNVEWLVILEYTIQRLRLKR